MSVKYIPPSKNVGESVHDINENFAALDKQSETIAQTVANKADAADVQNLATQLNSKADTSDLEAKVSNDQSGATELLDNLIESESTPQNEDSIILKHLNQYVRTPFTSLWNWIKSNLAKVAISGSYNDLSDKPDIPTVDSSFSEDGTNAVAGNVILSALNSKANKTELQALSNQISNKADKSEIPTVDDRSKIYPEISMTALGFTAKSTVTVYEFLSKLYEKGYTANSIVPIKWADANTATVSDGTNSISINGGTLYIGKLKDLSTSWKESHAVFIQNAGKGQTITIISAASSANTGASSAQHVTNFTSNAAYLKKTDVSNQPELYTSTTDTSSATITNLFANYSLVWFQAEGVKTTHTHILPLAYLKSKGSLTFKDSGTPINILYVSDTQIRWFEYQGQGAETYTSVTIVKII